MWQLIKQIAQAGIATEKAPEPNYDWRTERAQIATEILQILGRALCIREVDAEIGRAHV